MKHHPYLRKLLTTGNSERLSYGARVLNEGGLQSVPKLNFPGGALIGCSAGFVNIAKIKGTHNAMKSGMLAAEAAYEAVQQKASEEESDAKAADMAPYDKALHESWVHEDLKEVRNLRPSFGTKLGLWGGIMYSGIDSLFLKGRVPWTFKHHAPEGKSKNPVCPFLSFSIYFFLTFNAQLGLDFIPRLCIHRTSQPTPANRIPAL